MIYLQSISRPFASSIGLAPAVRRGSSCLDDIQGLVAQAQEGSSEAFARLYEAYYDRVFRYIFLRVGNRADAEDYTAEVFIKVLESLNSFKWRGLPFSAWLFRVAHNQLVDRVRQRKRQPVVYLDEDFSHPSDHVDVSDVVVQKLSAEALWAMLEKLTDNQRQVLTLRFGAGLSLEETAAALGKNANAIKALQHAGLLTMRRLLQRVEGAGSPGKGVG